MDDSKKDISQIKKYLNGELDARAMHQLEREAQDDPFLMDAIDGFEKSAAADAFNFDDLDQRLAGRIGESKVHKMFPWKYYAAAASVLLFFTVGYLMWPKPEAQQKLQVADLVQPAAPIDHTATTADTGMPPPQVQPSIALSKKQIRQSGTIIKAGAKGSVSSYHNIPADSSADNLAVLNESVVTKEYSPVEAKPKDSAANSFRQPFAKVNANTVAKSTFGNANAAKNYGNVGSAPAVRPVVPNFDSVTLKEITIPGLAKLNPGAIATKTAMQPETLSSKVKDAAVKMPKKGNNAMLSQLGLPLNPNLRTPTKNETQTDADGRLNLPTNGQAAADAKTPGYVASRSASSKTDEAAKPEGSNTGAAAYSKIKPDNIKEAHPKMGWDAYNKYLKAKATGSSGTVRLSFAVDAKGLLSDFRVLKSVDEATDKKAIDLVKNGPAWAADVSGKAKTVEVKVVFSKE